MPAPAVAIVTAAGSGTRLGASEPKALVTVAGQSLLRRATSGLLRSGVIDAVVVTAPPERRQRFADELADLADSVQVVAGSPASRQASVALGLRAALAAYPDAGVVLVHDAARALTPPEVTARVVAAVRGGHRAVVPAVPVTDTIKEVEPGRGPEQVVATPARNRLRAVQTPQGFDAATLVHAHDVGAQRAGDEAQAASDDAALVEAAGGRVVTVAGDPLAFKVTHRLDLALAEAILAQAR